MNWWAITLTPKAPYIAWANSPGTESGRYEDGSDDEGEPVFLEWFEVTISSMVEDVMDEPLIRE